MDWIDCSNEDVLTSHEGLYSMVLADSSNRHTFKIY